VAGNDVTVTQGNFIGEEACNLKNKENKNVMCGIERERGG
jgi:hypothetical protein